MQMNARTGRAAQLFLGALPVMMIYPFLQKYFTKGLVMGSVKDKSIKEQKKRSQRSKVMKQIEVSTYGIFPEDCRENTWKLRQMLDQLREEEGIQIIFEPGTYHFYPDYAVEKLLYISNHDEDTIKRIAFDLTGFQHLVIRGEETQFLFHTDVIPFYLHACEDITIEGVKIDYVRPGYSEGKIRELEPQRMVVEIDPTEYPYEIFNGRLYFAAKIFSMK